LVLDLILLIGILQFGLYVVHAGLHDLVHVHVVPVLVPACLHVEHREDDAIGSLCVLDDLRIHVKSEDKGRVLGRHVVVNVLLLLDNILEGRNHLLDSALLVDEELEGLSFVKNEITQLFVQLGVKHSSVPVVSDTSTLHGFSDQLFE